MLQGGALYIGSPHSAVVGPPTVIKRGNRGKKLAASGEGFIARESLPPFFSLRSFRASA